MGAVGLNMKEESTELRIFVMCNGNLNAYNIESYGQQKHSTSY